MNDKTPPDRKYEPFVTVVIPAYNEEECIWNTIQSIRAQTYPIREIIVVDDCSSDDTGEIARSLGATVIRLDKNSGTKSRAVNIAVPRIDSSLFVVIDADTILDPRAIEKLVPHLSDGETLSACGFVIPQVRKTIWERARTVEYLYGLGLFKEAQDHMSSPLVSSGCLSAFNRSIFNKLGGFPEGNIAEDMALTWLGLIRGYNVKYISDAICYPKEPANWLQYKRQVLRWYRGFFQCLKQYKVRLILNKRLAALVLYYTLTGILTPVWIVLFLYSMYSISMGGISWITGIISIGFVIEYLIGYITTIVTGRRVGLLRNAIVDFPLYYALSPINTALYLYSMLQELILNNKLSTWEKGH
jgi:biofilm PGA synthesis N-glycosyltransferase PgaC